MNIKKYEDKYKNHISTMNPVVCRLDGIGLHGKDRSKFIYSNKYLSSIKLLIPALYNFVDEIVAVYVISDEINIIINNNSKFLIDNHKVVSKITSKLSAFISANMSLYLKMPTYYDCRIFNVSEKNLNEYINKRSDSGYNVFVQDLLKNNKLSKKAIGLKKDNKINLLESCGIDISRENSFNKFGLLFSRHSDYCLSNFQIYDNAFEIDDADDVL